MTHGTYLEVLEEKLTVLNRICGNVEIDRNSIEECIQAIAMNSEEFKALIEIEARLEGMIREETQEVREVLAEATGALMAVHEATASILESIRRERETMAKNLGEFSRVDAIRNSSVKVGHRPVFVDKDFN